MIFPADCCTRNYLGVGNPLCFHCMDSCLVSGNWWWADVSSPVIIFGKPSGFALSMSKFPSLNCSRHAFYSGVNIRGTHRELTFHIIKTEWMILETVPAGIALLMSCNTRVHCRPARHCTCHPPTASTSVRLISNCGCYMSRYVPTFTCKVTSSVAMLDAGVDNLLNALVKTSKDIRSEVTP